MKRLPASLSVEALRAAWKGSRDSKPGNTPGAPGVDQVRAAVFASNVGREIADIRRRIQDGSHRFSKLRLAPVPKPNGGHRILAIPTVRDRLLQRALLRGLEEDSRFKASSPIAYGFTKGKSLADAQRTACSLRAQKPWVLQADIIKFFDRIQRPQLQQLIRRKVRGKAVSDLLCAATCCEIEEVGGKGAEIIKAAGITAGVGLRQGMPVSPMLSNLLLKSFDEDLCKGGFTAVRYADDIAIFGASREELMRALSLVERLLGVLGLAVPGLDDQSKTVIRAPSEVVEFLGVEIRRAGIDYVLAAPHHKLASIEADMAKVASVSECVASSRNIGQVVHLLDSFVIGHRASMAVLNDASSFYERLEAAKQRQLVALLTEVIGKNAVSRLDANGRAILGLERFA